VWLPERVQIGDAQHLALPSCTALAQCLTRSSSSAASRQELKGGRVLAISPLRPAGSERRAHYGTRSTGPGQGVAVGVCANSCCLSTVSSSWNLVVGAMAYTPPHGRQITRGEQSTRGAQYDTLF